MWDNIYKIKIKNMKTCKNPWCKKEFTPTRKNQKYCSKECAAFIHERQKFLKNLEDIPVLICETCGKEHDGSYGSGRFCSKECAKEFIAQKNRNAKNPKIKAHLDKLRREGKVSNRSPYGTWKCKICDYICETRALLKKHNIEQHNCQISSKKNTCPYCGKEFESNYKLGGHLHSCKLHPLKEQHDLSAKQVGKRLSAKYKSGELIPSFKGKHHSAISKQLMREAACRYLQNNNPTPCRYNKYSIKVLEQIAKEHNWNIQHAENGGEFYTGIGYWLDAYDKEKNIALEYDEPEHYEDVENNILREKDLIRQKEIIEHLHCEYWRYNEKTHTLWKVN